MPARDRHSRIESMSPRPSTIPDCDAEKHAPHLRASRAHQQDALAHGRTASPSRLADVARVGRFRHRAGDWLWRRRRAGIGSPGPAPAPASTCVLWAWTATRAPWPAPERAPRALSQVHVRLGGIDDLAGLARTVDYVFCNHVLHHVPPDDVVPSPAQAAPRRATPAAGQRPRALGRGLRALHRLGGVAFHKSFVYADGRLSIRKGFRVPELGGLRAGRFPRGCRVERVAPWRVVIVAPGMGPSAPAPGEA